MDGNPAYPEAPNLEITLAGEEGGLLEKTELSLYGISSGENALPLKVDRRTLLHGGFVCESRYFRLDYKTQNVPSLQVRAVMENL